MFGMAALAAHPWWQFRVPALWTGLWNRGPLTTNLRHPRIRAGGVGFSELPRPRESSAGTRSTPKGLRPGRGFRSSHSRGHVSAWVNDRWMHPRVWAVCSFAISLFHENNSANNGSAFIFIGWCLFGSWKQRLRVCDYVTFFDDFSFSCRGDCVL
jgi:hypothetical protein